MAGKPDRYVLAPPTVPIASRIGPVFSAASAASSGVLIWTNATSRLARCTGPTLAPDTSSAARRAAPRAAAANSGSCVEPPLASRTSVKLPSPFSPKCSERSSRPRSASEPGTLKRLLSRSPRAETPSPPSTNTASHAAIDGLGEQVTVPDPGVEQHAETRIALEQPSRQQSPALAGKVQVDDRHP